MRGSLNSREMYEVICDTFRDLKPFCDELRTDEDSLTAEGDYYLSHLVIKARCYVNKKDKMISFYFWMPFKVPTCEAASFSEKLLKYNYDNFLFGAYDYNNADGSVLFRNNFSLKEAEVTESFLRDHIRSTFEMVGNSAWDIYDLVNSPITDFSVSDGNAQDIANALAGIDSLVGWERYKEVCHDIGRIVPRMIKEGLKDSVMCRNYLFSVNDGYGLTTALEHMIELFGAIGLIGKTDSTVPFEVTLAEDDDEPGCGSTANIVEWLSDKDNTTPLLCINISGYIEKSKHLELKNLLTHLLPFEDSFIFVFRVPFLEPAALKDISAIIGDVLYTVTIDCAPFDSDRLKEYALLRFNELNFTVTDDIWDIFFSRVSEEKSDGRFYGLRSIDNLIHELLWEKFNHVTEDAAGGKIDGTGADGDVNDSTCKTDVSDENDEASDENDEASNDGTSTSVSDPARIITRSDLSGFSSTYGHEVVDGFTELNELIGMEDITARIREIVAQVKTSLANSNIENPCLHMRFLGAPGTGKTTVARIIGRIFRENGILRNGYFFEYMARDLVGAYVGQTAPKTAGICRDAYGSVLFIDEAYSLYTSDSNDKDYGPEALTTLVSEMENHRNDMVVIMAGYTDDMNRLMKGNAGLRSRMPFILDFKNYTKEQLYEIFMLFVKKHFEYTEDFAETAHEYFLALSDEYMASKEFANARFARNLYERTWSKAALRCSLSKGPLKLTREDFVSASSEAEFSETLQIKHRLGF